MFNLLLTLFLLFVLLTRLLDLFAVIGGGPDCIR